MLSAVGRALLAGWLVWWAVNLRLDRMRGASVTWVPALPSLSGDFLVSIDHVARIRAEGRDPYTADWICELFPYPPLVPAAFAWVTLLSPRAAAAVWTAALAALAALGAGAAWGSRRRLGLSPLPLGLTLALVLSSTPVLFAMERGQCDLLVLPGLLAGAHLLRQPSRRAQRLAGAAFALAAWVKFYPGLVVLGLFTMRRWRALVGFVAVGLLIGAADLPGALKALTHTQHPIAMYRPIRPEHIAPIAHSLSGHWRALWADTRLARVARLPGLAAAAGLLLPGAVAVSVSVARGRRGVATIEPYVLWLVAAATFLPQAASDYNLVFLPMAMVAVWDRRDHPALHVAMLFGVLGLQPLALPVGGRILLLSKLTALVATGLCLIRRASEATPVGSMPEEASTARLDPASGTAGHHMALRDAARTAARTHG